MDQQIQHDNMDHNCEDHVANPTHHALTVFKIIVTALEAAVAEVVSFHQTLSKNWSVSFAEIVKEVSVSILVSLGDVVHGGEHEDVDDEEGEEVEHVFEADVDGFDQQTKLIKHRQTMHSLHKNKQYHNTSEIILYCPRIIPFILLLFWIVGVGKCVDDDE